MSVTQISMTQVQGVLQQSKRRTGAKLLNDAANKNGVSRFETLLREPQQVADAMASSQSLNPAALQIKNSYFGLSEAERAVPSGMNLRNVSALATLINVASVEPTVLSGALKTLTEAAEKNQLETVSAYGVGVNLQGMMSREVENDSMDTVAQVSDSAMGDSTDENESRSVEHIVTNELRGALATMFESGAAGNIGAIGYDETGGTSYGKYQFSSARGTMDDFLTYLDTHASDISLHLRAAGAVNTGSKEGEMPTAWQEVANIDPVRFEKMQDAFMQSRYFTPVARVIQDKMDVSHLSTAMEEVLLSTSLQHGPRGAVKIFAKAFGETGGFSEEMQEAFIKNVYALRRNEFATSTPKIQESVQNRLDTELNVALSMLA
ncbi:VgrG-related protein [Halodesulfovibrio marinisediminis]|uniref:Type VI secretion system spike protein VgrG3-like C-terminal domain-containing protein n=1 Tax=Halodesulfovibrio marinisediminis DSM 17456 TaxID=1121457 RepID=A0A1N6GMS0_9BACT|nr:hypothetical protein [Halodesulfovibrio marinisediminis]SIO08824.1 hypothetical protein SAMN02745161_1693 [Halodesulfovibrio marinisediminis DSM 17456]